MKATYVGESSSVPIAAYVFPALRLDSRGQAVDALTHRMNDDGELLWYSPAPRGGEIQAVIQNALKGRGFRVITFAELQNYPEAHSVVVFNPYFTEVRKSEADIEKNVPGGWSTFTRITGSTYPADLDPSQKRDIIQQEVVTLFSEKSAASDVIKQSAANLIQAMGQNREWSETLSLVQ